jgi:hypothetical protein
VPCEESKRKPNTGVAIASAVLHGMQIAMGSMKFFLELFTSTL